MVIPCQSNYYNLVSSSSGKSPVPLVVSHSSLHDKIGKNSGPCNSITSWPRYQVKLINNLTLTTSDECTVRSCTSAQVDRLGCGSCQKLKQPHIDHFTVECTVRSCTFRTAQVDRLGYGSCQRGENFLNTTFCLLPLPAYFGGHLSSVISYELANIILILYIHVP